MKESSIIQTIPNSSQQNLINQVYTPTQTIVGLSAVTVPFILLFSVIAYQQYRIFAWRQRVYKLEKIWRIAPIEDNHRN